MPIKQQNAKTVEIPESDLGYVLIARRRGLKPGHVYFRYGREVVEEAKRRLEQREDVVQIVIEPAASYQERMNSRPPEDRAHDDWGEPIDVLQSPLITELEGGGE